MIDVTNLLRDGYLSHRVTALPKTKDRIVRRERPLPIRLMLRAPRSEDQTLETLLEERDTLKIRLSLLLYGSDPDEEKVRALRKTIFEADSRIKTYYPPA